MSEWVTGAGIFPLPGVGSPRGRPTARSRRHAARYRCESHAAAVANRTVRALNMHASNSYDPRFPFPSPISPSSSASQVRMVEHVHSSARRFVRSPTFRDDLVNHLCDPHGDGTDVPSQSFPAAAAVAHAAAEDGAGVSSVYAVSDKASAVPLVADNVSLPDVAGEVDMLSALPEEDRRYYSDPKLCLRAAGGSDGGASGARPRGRVFAPHREYVKLLRLMHSRRMLAYTTEPRAVNSLFGVAKPDGSTRLIMDGRAANEVFADPPHVELPSPDLLARLQVPQQQQQVWVAKSDLSDFFFRFFIPEWMLPYFAFPSVAAEELPAEIAQQYARGTRVFPCMRVLAMGWSHSVNVAQRGHLNLIATALVCGSRIASHV